MQTIAICFKKTLKLIFVTFEYALIYIYISLWLLLIAWNPLHYKSTLEFSGPVPVHVGINDIIANFIYIILPASIGMFYFSIKRSVRDQIDKWENALPDYQNIDPTHLPPGELIWDLISTQGLGRKHKKLLDLLKKSQFIAFDLGKSAVHLPTCVRVRRKYAKWHNFIGYSDLKQAITDGYPACEKCFSATMLQSQNDAIE